MSVVQEGSYVILRRKNHLRIQKLDKVTGSSKDSQVQLGKDTVDIREIVGHNFGSFFKLNHLKGRNFKATYTDSVTDLSDAVLEGVESGEDNRSLWDDGASQKLSHEEIARLRKEGVSAADLVKQLVENSATFQQKTGFSQEKYVKKKEEKYFEYVEVLRPSIRLIVQMLYSQNPLKILNLRLDMLSQILTRANVRSGGRYLVFENSCLGLVTAAVMERVGHIGQVYQVHGGTTPPTQCIEYLNFSEEIRQSLKCISIGHLRKLMNMVEAKDGEDTPVADATNLEASTVGAEVTRGEGEKADGGKRKMEHCDRSEDPKKQKMSSKAWNEASESWAEIKENPLDGLVIATRQPEPLVMPLLGLLAPSRCFAVFSPHLEPLSACYTAIKSSGIALNLRLSETWLRNYQVLPGRTHPEINMSGGGGYLLSGTTCLKG